MATRDAGWFDTLFANHAPAVFRFLVRRAQRVDAADLTADVFVIAWRRRSQIPPPAELPWLYRTAGLVLREPSPPQAAAVVLTGIPESAAVARWTDNADDIRQVLSELMPVRSEQRAGPGRPRLEVEQRGLA